MSRKAVLVDSRSGPTTWAGLPSGGSGILACMSGRRSRSWVVLVRDRLRPSAPAVLVLLSKAGDGPLIRSDSGPSSLVRTAPAERRQNHGRSRDHWIATPSSPIHARRPWLATSPAWVGPGLSVIAHLEDLAQLQQGRPDPGLGGPDRDPLGLADLAGGASQVDSQQQGSPLLLGSAAIARRSRRDCCAASSRSSARARGLGSRRARRGRSV
jgi:hypothetical protein